MTSLEVPADDEGFTVETRHAWPEHCVTKIKSFSALSKRRITKLESMEFDAGEYKWKLIIYPDGDDKAMISTGFISVYVSMVGTASRVVNAIVSFFIYNHISDNYLCFRGKVRRFHDIKSKWGISKLMTKACFTDPSNGYLINDKCVFGAEVFVLKNQPVIENVCVLTKTDPFMREWKISDFSKQQYVWNSEEFDAGGFKWKVSLKPNVNSEAKGRYISIFLECIDSRSFAVHNKVEAAWWFIIKISDQKHYSKKATHWFSSHDSEWGFPELMEVEDFGDPSKGFLVIQMNLSVLALREELKLE